MAWSRNFNLLFKESSSTEQALITGDLSLRGDVFLSAPGSVDMVLEGSLHSTTHVTIDEAARIKGACQAKNMHVGGTVEGNLTSQEHLRMIPGSHIRGKVTSTTIEITAGADFQGELEIGPTSSH